MFLGKAGSKISDIRYQSGAEIVLPKKSEDEFVTIKISGTESEVQRAKEIIDSIANRPNKPRENSSIHIPHIPTESHHRKPESEAFDSNTWAALFEQCVSVH